MRSWWRVWKHGWAHGQQTSLMQAYKSLLPDMKSAPILEATMLRSSLSMYILFVYNKMFSHCLVCWQLTGDCFPHGPCIEAYWMNEQLVWRRHCFLIQSNHLYKYVFFCACCIKRLQWLNCLWNLLLPALVWLSHCCQEFIFSYPYGVLCQTRSTTEVPSSGPMSDWVHHMFYECYI
jgi:hypothetical protein